MISLLSLYNDALSVGTAALNLGKILKNSSGEKCKKSLRLSKRLFGGKTKAVSLKFL